MSESNEAPAGDALRELADRWSDAESGRAESFLQLLAPIEEAVSQLAGWADQFAAAEEAETKRREEFDSREQAAETRRRRLEHDLRLARGRVSDLERTLQQRTEELLQAQAANNELAAQLQAVGDDSLDDNDYSAETYQEEGYDGTHDEQAPVGVCVGVEGEGVSERFAHLRRTE